MKQKRSLLLTALLLVVSAVLTLSCVFMTACTPEEEVETYAVTWSVPDGVTATADGYDALPESVTEGTTIVVSLTVPNGYEATLKASGKTISEENGKYSIEIKKDTNVVVTTEKKVTGITVTAPTNLSYYAGDKLDTTGMVVTVNYATGESEVITSGYTVAPEVFSEGDTEVTISYKGQSQTIALSGAVQSRSFTMTSVALKVVDDKPCYILTGSYANYETDMFNTIKFDFQENGYFGDPYDSSTVYGGWAYEDVADEKVKLTKFGNGVFELTIDMSDLVDLRTAVDLEGNYMGTCYLPHVGFSETAGDNARPDIKVAPDGEVVIEEGQSITVGDMTYTLLSGDAEKNWVWWNICAVVVKNNAPVEEAPEGGVEAVA